MSNEKSIRSSPTKINLGSGPRAHDGWIDVDFALGARIAKLPLVGRAVQRAGLFKASWDPSIQIHDLRKPLPWASGSVDCIYTSHTLEHLTRSEGRDLLSECSRVLRARGVVRVVVPDLRSFVDRYLAGEFGGDEFVDRLGVLPLRTGPLGRNLAPFVEFPHRCMYDREALDALVQEVGLDGKTRSPLDSVIPGIEMIESERSVNTSLIVEAVKPPLETQRTEPERK